MKAEMVVDGSVMPTETPYYKVSETCQIPRLAEIYELFFGKKPDGIFVEVGAFDGEYVSNTSCLADLGWTGHYIEPVKEYYEKCCARHAKNKNVTVHNTGIGSKQGEEIEIATLGPISTLRSDSLENYQNIDWAREELPDAIEKQKVRLEVLDNFLETIGVPSGFDLLVVDVEGFEHAVLYDFPLEKWRIQMVIVELHDISCEYTFLHKELMSLHRKFISSGYIPIYKDFTNCIYLRDDLYLPVA